MKWLEDILKDVEGKEQLSKDIQKALGTYFVPREDFNAKNEELKNAKQQIEARDKNLAELKEKHKDVEGLQEQIAELQNLNKEAAADYDAKVHELKISTAIEKALYGKAYDAALVGGLMDKEKLVLADDGKVIGLEDQISGLKEAKPFLFISKEGKKDPIRFGAEASTSADAADAAISAAFGNVKE